MKRVHIMSAIGLSLVLAACGSKTPGKTPGAASGAESSGAMANMVDPAAIETTLAKTTGKVAALDPAAGTVTIAHAAIPEVKWPAMTMTFKVDPKLLSGIAAGDQVAFDLIVKGSAGEVTALKKL
jgi:Cu/Ag efflux protein CusF